MEINVKQKSSNFIRLLKNLKKMVILLMASFFNSDRKHQQALHPLVTHINIRWFLQNKANQLSQYSFIIIPWLKLPLFLSIDELITCKKKQFNSPSGAMPHGKTKGFTVFLFPLARGQLQWNTSLDWQDRIKWKIDLLWFLF